MKILAKKLIVVFIVLITIMVSVFIVVSENLSSDILEKEKIEDREPLFVKILTDSNSGTVPYKVNFNAGT